MKRTIPYLLVVLVLVGVSVLFLNPELFRSKQVELADVLVKGEDLSGTDLYVRYRETTGADYYDLPIGKEISQTTTAHLAGEYKKDENRTMFLTSTITKYVDSAVPHLEDTKKTITDNLGNWQLAEKFIPKFETASFYEYRDCAKATQLEGKKVYVVCVVSSVTREHYLFTLVLHGDGEITKNEIESILGAALKDKQDILERLP